MALWVVLGLLWLAALFWAPGSGRRILRRIAPGKRLRRLPVVRRVIARRNRPAPPDPFVTIRVQQRLATLSEQIRRLEDDEEVFAKAARLVAHRAAYDDLLDQAFSLAGLEVPTQCRSESRRLDAELELTGRGWSW